MIYLGIYFTTKEIYNHKITILLIQMNKFECPMRQINDFILHILPELN